MLDLLVDRTSVQRHPRGPLQLSSFSILLNQLSYVVWQHKTRTLSKTINFNFSNSLAYPWHVITQYIRCTQLFDVTRSYFFRDNNHYEYSYSKQYVWHVTCVTALFTFFQISRIFWMILIGRWDVNSQFFSNQRISVKNWKEFRIWKIYRQFSNFESDIKIC